MKNQKPLNPSVLRLRAEIAMESKEASLPNLLDLSEEEGQRVLHELQVHQIELEMQNEELRQIQKDLELSRKRYRDLYDNAPVGYVTLDEEGLIQEANRTIGNLLGLLPRQLENQPITNYIFPEDQDVFYLQRRQLLSTQHSQTREIRLVAKNQEVIWCRLESFATKFEDKPYECRVIISDISELKKIKEKLQQ